jgi:hypothetical protein
MTFTTFVGGDHYHIIFPPSSSVNLDFESEWKIHLSSNISENFDPFSLAYDWAGGHIVLTETDAFQVKLVTADGLRHGSLLDLIRERPLVVDKPGEVVFDSEMR